MELNPRKRQFRLVFTSLERSVILQKLNKLDEFANRRSIAGLQIQRSGIARAVMHYNQFRPHKNLGMKTPFDFIEKWNKMKPNERPKITIFDNGN